MFGKESQPNFSLPESLPLESDFMLISVFGEESQSVLVLESFSSLSEILSPPLNN